MVKLEMEIDFKALGEVLAEHDFVEVIRCKNCKWFNDIGCAIRIVDDSDKPKDDDYCSFGERKGESTMGQLNSDERISEVEKL